MILVFGATGNTGGEVARQLIAAGQRPRLLVRNVEKARAAFGDSAEIVRGDLDDAAALDAAMKGIDHVYLVATGSNPVELERKAIDAAKRAGVKHVVKLSVIGADDPQLVFSKWHAAAEQQLKASGLGWTMVRPGNFMTNSLGWADTIRSQGVFYQPTGTGRWAAIDPADIGAVAVAALTKPGHEGQAYTITGPESMDAAGYAAVLSKALGKPVSFVDVPPEAAKGGMLASGMPAGYVDALLDLLAAMKAGRADGVVSGEVKRLTGREPGTFAAWAERNRAAFGA